VNFWLWIALAVLAVPPGARAAALVLARLLGPLRPLLDRLR